METAFYSELTKTSTALARLAVTCVLSAARRLVLNDADGGFHGVVIGVGGLPLACLQLPGFRRNVC